MKLGLLVILALMVGSVATHFMMEDNGYVLINFRGYTIEMSVPILLLLFFLSYLAVRLITRIWRAPRQLGEIAARARYERSNRQITRGFIALAEGKLARGERLLTKGAANSGAPLLNYLAAARTAQMQGDRERRDSWLKIAYEQNTEARSAVLLTQAELQLADGEYEQSRASLGQIREKYPNHPQALKLLAELNFQQKNWGELNQLLPALRRAKNVNPEQLDSWTVQAFENELIATGIGREKIEQSWQDLPRPLRKSMPLIRARIKALATCGEAALAESEIRKALKAEWNDNLVTLYGQLDLADGAAQLRHIEAWLNKRPEDASLLLAAGRACIKNQLWGKARSYLESSVAIRPSPAAYHELGQLMLNLDEPQAATVAFSKGLTLSNTGSTPVPRLAASDS
jgi:HemY protein